VQTSVDGLSMGQDQGAHGNAAPAPAPASSSSMRKVVVLVASVACISIAALGRDKVMDLRVDLPVSESTRRMLSSMSRLSMSNNNIEPEQKYGTFHQAGFGGILNTAHHAGMRHRHRHRHRRHLAGGDNNNDHHIAVPISAVPHAVPSLTAENIENLHGHYVHDEHFSPFASPLYARPKIELQAEQKEFLQKMEQVRSDWGSWDFKEEFTKIRPLANYEKVPYKDMKREEFPDKSWQTDEDYTRTLISEGRKLMSRMREGIYAEYGHPTRDFDLNEDKEKIKERDALFEVHVVETIGDAPDHTKLGVAWITEKGFEALVKKLLHGMMTNDEFYYIMGGHSAAAGHGNNFQQQYTMQFANIMEPVFHKLGMRLIARNLAMGGLGTAHFSLGSNTLYGETDFLLWDSHMTEKTAEDIDVFHKQALLGGERVPILFGGQWSNLEEETGGPGSLWGGDRMLGHGIIPLTTGYNQVETLPVATQYQECDDNVMELCSSRANENKYHNACWEPRRDYEPETKQNPFVGGMASWHPGDRNHQFQSRKSILVFLKAFDAVFDTWEEGLDKEGTPLQESYWHVGEDYEKFHSDFSSHLNGVGLNTTACEKRWGALDGLEKVCRISMNGMAEFTPINRGRANSVSAHVKRASNGYHPIDWEKEPAYEGIDILPLIWKIPIDQIDLHAIAMSSAYAPPEFDDSIWEDDDDAESADSSRRERKMTWKDSSDASVSSIDRDQSHLRALTDDNKVLPGLGWQLTNHFVTGYCDGSPMSDCLRRPEDTCLLSGHNDGHAGLSGNALSGWIVINVPKVKEGLIFAKMEWWHPRGTDMEITKDWTEVNDGIALGEGRKLGGNVKDLPEDFFLDIAVNGKITRTYNYEEFKVLTKEIAYNQAFYPFVNDESLVTGDEPEAVELGLRIRSESSPKDASFSLTHIYYA